MITYDKVNMTVYRKDRKIWIETAHNDERSYVYQCVFHDLFAKKIHNCTYIKRIRYEPLYNGFQKIIVYYDNGVKTVYIIEK